MHNILVPVDFSETAEKAIAAAKLIASRTGAQLTMLHAYQPYVNDISVPVTVSSLPVYQELENSGKQKLGEYVAQARKEGYQAEGIWETTGIHAEILGQAKKLPADLIVVGRTGKGGFLETVHR